MNEVSPDGKPEAYRTVRRRRRKLLVLYTSHCSGGFATKRHKKYKRGGIPDLLLCLLCFFVAKSFSFSPFCVICVICGFLLTFPAGSHNLAAKFAGKCNL